MTKKKVCGVYTAVLTPRHPDDTVDVPAFRKLLEFQMAQGVTGFAVNGATGEFCLTTPAQLKAILATVQEVTGGKAEVLCGVGAAGSAMAHELAAIAKAHKVNALLLPMPYFFPYKQEDLDSFCRTVAAGTDLPVMLYNLPQFTSGLEKQTVRSLITEVPNIIGIKDSSGSLEILRDLTAHQVDACRIVGNDSALAPAMRERVCDGVVSGVACVLPELILALYGQLERTDSAEFAQTTELLEQFIAQLDAFPTPWGLKWIAESRGILCASFSQPVTAHRLAQSAAMADWFTAWQANVMQAVSLAEL